MINGFFVFDEDGNVNDIPIGDHFDLTHWGFSDRNTSVADVIAAYSAFFFATEIVHSETINYIKRAVKLRDFLLSKNIPLNHLPKDDDDTFTMDDVADNIFFRESDIEDEDVNAEEIAKFIEEYCNELEILFGKEKADRQRHEFFAPEA